MAGPWNVYWVSRIGQAILKGGEGLSGRHLVVVVVVVVAAAGVAAAAGVVAAAVCIHRRLLPVALPSAAFSVRYFPRPAVVVAAASPPIPQPPFHQQRPNNRPGSKYRSDTAPGDDSDRGRHLPLSFCP